MVSQDDVRELRRFTRSGGQHSIKRIIADIEILHEHSQNPEITVNDAAFVELQNELHEALVQIAHLTDGMITESDSVTTDNRDTPIDLPNAKLEDPFDRTKLGNLSDEDTTL